MKAGKVQAKAAVVLVLILIIVGIIVAGITKENSMPKLSKEKMQENMEQAEKVKEEEAKASDEKTEADGGYTKELKSFQISVANTAADGEGKEEGQAEAGEAKETKGVDEQKESEEKGEYLCSYTSDRLVTEEDVEELNSKTYENLPQGKGIIQMVVNEIYARYGYQFQNEEIQSYFDQKEWYQNIKVRNTNMDDVIKNMTKTERENVEFLSAYIVEE